MLSRQSREDIASVELTNDMFHCKKLCQTSAGRDEVVVREFSKIKGGRVHSNDVFASQYVLGMGHAGR